MLRHVAPGADMHMHSNALYQPERRGCEVCAEHVPQWMGAQCWGCGHFFHSRCLGEGGITDRVWVCPCCRESAKDLGLRDLVLDRHLMQVVCGGTVGDAWEPAECKRVQAAAEWLRWDAGRLWQLGAVQDRQVPPIWQR
jgi:hypothetical protein